MVSQHRDGTSLSNVIRTCSWLTLCLLVAVGSNSDASGVNVINWQQQPPPGAPGSPLLVHIHIEKAGGSNFNREIKFRYQKGAKLLRRCFTPRPYRMPITEVVGTHGNFSGCNYLSLESGLWVTDHLPAHLDVKTLMLLRNPLELVVSRLEHAEHRGNGQHPHTVLDLLAQGKPAQEIFELHNPQTKMLVCGPLSPTQLYKVASCNYTSQQLAAAADQLTSSPASAHLPTPVPATAAQRQRRRQQLWWVGIVEYYEVSMCVLSYQLGMFNATGCDCRPSGSLPRILPRNVFGFNKFGVNVANASGSSYNIDQMKMISDMNRDDLWLYSVAVKRLLDDAREVERATGVELLCGQRG